MKIHKAITRESLRVLLSALMECGAKDAPVVATTGAYHGRPAVVVAVQTDDAFLPLAVLVDHEAGDTAYLTMDGATARGGEAPSAPSVADDAALAVLRDVAASPHGGVLAERAARVLAGRPVAPAAPVERVGVYL